MIKNAPRRGFFIRRCLLLPNYSDIVPKDVQVTTRLTRNLTLNIPLVSAAMDTVTEADVAICMARKAAWGSCIVI